MGKKKNLYVIIFNYPVKYYNKGPKKGINTQLGNSKMSCIQPLRDLIINAILYIIMSNTQYDMIEILHIPKSELLYKFISLRWFLFIIQQNFCCIQLTLIITNKFMVTNKQNELSTIQAFTVYKIL